MTEVTGTVIDLTTASLTLESGLDNTHPGVHESSDEGVAFVVIGVCRDDLDGRHGPDLLRGKTGEFD